MRHKKASLIWGGLLGGISLWFLGEYLMKMYGFDPPYIVFWTGLLMKPVGALCIVASLIAAVVHFFRKGF